ncbi:hypothetical protein [Rufibacter roseus]|uniref:Right-handed parallel beta-helix repeat-containing protein n=1 Tax=Rufibacter roseus TaxID=1567108 RepID=A0ABW2DTI8_9BACT|nr:hypothetical protein [Rufibacter roseus]
MSKFTKTGNWFVDSFYGNDSTGTGTKENPFATLERAHTAASNGHTVVFTGKFFPNLPSTKALHWVGEGEAICDGSNLASGAYGFNSGTWASITGVKFQFYQGGARAYAQSSANTISESTFNFCSIFSSGNVWSIERCILNEVEFTRQFAGVSTVNLRKNTFTKCTGILRVPNSSAASAAYAYTIVDNYFHGCEGVQFELPADRVANSEFNHNNISGTLGGRTAAQWAAYGDGSYMNSGYSETPANTFNDFQAGRDSTNFYYNDYTLKPTSILINAAKDRLEIGAKRVGYRFTAENIWNNYRNIAETNNITYDAGLGFMLLDDGIGAGTFTSTKIPKPQGMLDIINLFAAFVYSGANAVQYIDQTPNAARDTTINQRFSFDCDFAYQEDEMFGDPIWTKQEFNRRIRIDSNGYGVADDGYNVASAQIPMCDFFYIRFTLRNTAA